MHTQTRLCNSCLQGACHYESVPHACCNLLAKHIHQALAVACREVQDLKHGAVRTATLKHASGQMAHTGDVAVFDYEVLPAAAASHAVSAAAERLLAGQAQLHAAALGKGTRIPRAWEITLQGALILRQCRLLCTLGLALSGWRAVCTLCCSAGSRKVLAACQSCA